MFPYDTSYLLKIYIFDRDYVDIDKCNSTEINYAMLFENPQRMA